MEARTCIKKTLKGVSILSLAAGLGLATSSCMTDGGCGKGSCGGDESRDSARVKAATPQDLFVLKTPAGAMFTG